MSGRFFEVSHKQATVLAHGTVVGPDGGLLFAWSELRRAEYKQTRFRRLTDSAQPSPLEPDTGRIVQRQWRTRIASCVHAPLAVARQRHVVKNAFPRQVRRPCRPRRQAALVRHRRKYGPLAASAS